MTALRCRLSILLIRAGFSVMPRGFYRDSYIEALNRAARENLSEIGIDGGSNPWM